jgi:hypothetical protein
VLQKLFLVLDSKGWPQRFVKWSVSRRNRSALVGYLLPTSGGTHAVTLTIATPLIAYKDLFDAMVPTKFGGWREFKVTKTVLQGDIAVAMLKDIRSDTEFALVLPIHADFKARRFKRAKKLRLVCEAERAGLVTIREPGGFLLAAGTLEYSQKAAFSERI